MSAIDFLGVFFFSLSVLVLSDLLFNPRLYPDRWRAPHRLIIDVILAACITYILYKLT